MNEFTKEELKIISNKFESLSFSEFKGCGALYLKLQDMIHNYCEHEIEITGNESGHGHNWGSKCRKCGKVLR